MKSEKKWWSPEIITAIATVIIAVISTVLAGLALWISWQDHKETRENNRTSVVPYLTAFVNQNGEEDSSIGIALCNDGLGPARITNLQLYDDGKPLPALQNGAYQAVLKNHPNIKGDGTVQLYWLTLGKIIRAGEKIYLIYLTPNDESAPDVAEFEEALSHITFKVQYESFYHEPGELTFNGNPMFSVESKENLKKLNLKFFHKN